MKNRIVVIAALLLMLSGCASIDLSNRAARTLDCTEVHIISKLGKWFGVATVLDARDAKAILKDCPP